MIDPTVFETMFQGWIDVSGCTTVAITPLTQDNTAPLSKLENPSSIAPNYLINSWDLRCAPLKAFPFAKSLIAAAFPFHSLPELPAFPVSEFAPFNGIIAGYADRQDYHITGREAMLSLAEAIAQTSNSPVKYEICIDTAPLAERNIAEISGLGKRGYNDCILCKNEASGCYLTFMVLNIELPTICPEEISPPCHECKRCIQSCPSSVLGSDRFKLEKCVSFLSMEKRGELSPDEAALLGENIFGCSQCTATCPGTNMPDDIKIDLEWLLMSSTGEVRKVIKRSPAEYAGITLLRRNALYVLNSRKNEKCNELIKRFRKRCGSEFLNAISANMTD